MHQGNNRQKIFRSISFCLQETHENLFATVRKNSKLEMWANAQPDGRPAEHRWRPLFNAAKFG